MPTPNPNESREDFVSRCIPVVINEGTARNVGQAYAICISFYERENKELKSEENEPKRKRNITEETTS
jgi:hypothetical protein